MKLIGHIDVDCFYVSCERVRDPYLKNKPVGVLSNQGACVIARSYEMKEFGVKVGTPIWEAKKLCPDGIYIKRDFRWYGVLSRAMQDVLTRYSDLVEYYSIDESFVDFGSYEGDWLNLGQKIQNQIQEVVGVPVSIGLSMSRILSKIASSRDKPHGVTVVDMEGLNKFLEQTLIAEIPGIGRRLSRRLQQYSIKTAWDYVQWPSFAIKKIVNKPGEEIWYELKGKSVLPVRRERPEHKAVSRGGSVWGHHKDPKHIWGFLVRNLERLADALWQKGVETLRLEIILITSDGRYFKYVQSLPDYTYSYYLLLKALRFGFKKVFKTNVSYCATHLVAWPVRSVQQKQLSLFSLEKNKRKKIVQAKRAVNKKFGLYVLRSASTAYVPEVFKDKTSNFEISDVGGKFCF
ncbi:nucleotidyltransferase [Patescibacteria group bacterium]